MTDTSSSPTSEGSTTDRFLSHFFDYTRQAAEILFQMKLQMYEEACLPIMEELQKHRNNKEEASSSTNTASTGEDHQDDIFIDFSKQKSSTRDQTKFVDEADMFITSLFQQLPSGFNDSTSSSASSVTAFNPFLYGEIEPVGVRQVAGFMLDAAVNVSQQMYKKAVAKENKSETLMTTHLQQKFKDGKKILFDEIFFIDLGSGVGKCVLELPLFCNCHVSSKMTMPPSPRLGWEDKSIPPVSALGIELEPERAAIAVMARQLIAVSFEQELQQLKEKFSTTNKENTASSSSDDDDGISAETMTDVFGKVIHQRTRLIHGDMLNEKLEIKIQHNFDHLSSSNVDGLVKTYQAGVFPFCCGVAFDNDTCKRIVERVLEIDHHQQNQEDTKLRLLGGVFLFREWPYGFVEQSTTGDDTKTRREYKVPSPKWKVEKIVLATSWMSEAPAFSLSLKTQNN